MTTCASDRVREQHYQLGVVDITVSSELPEALADFDTLYRRWRQPVAAPHAIQVSATRGPRAWWGGRRFTVSADGQPIYGPRHRDELLPHLEWGVNWRVIVRRNDFLQIHAATMVRNGRAVLLVGESGCGKTTLAAGLMARGWTYFCDEFALLEAATLRAHWFPRALCVKAGAFDAVRAAGLEVWRRQHFAKHFKGPVGYVRPSVPADPQATRPAAVRHIIFPRYEAGATPRLVPISRAAAALAVLQASLNRGVFGAAAPRLVCRLVRGADCHLLEAGPLAETCRLVELLPE